MTKYFTVHWLLILFFLCSNFSMIICMLPCFDYLPITKQDSDAEQWGKDREGLFNVIRRYGGMVEPLGNQILYSDKSIYEDGRKKIIDSTKNNPISIVSMEGGSGVCFNYVLREMIQYKKYLSFKPGSDFEPDMSIGKYFDQIKLPQAGCVAIYTTSASDLSIQHFGIVRKISPYIVIESKWGHFPLILRHALFSIPEQYGNVVGFFILKDHYCSDLNRLHRHIDTNAALQSIRDF